MLLADGDQHPHPTKADEHTGPRFEEGKENSHTKEDAKDSRGTSAKADAEKKADKQQAQEEEEKKHQKPTDIAESHGECIATAGWPRGRTYLYVRAHRQQAFKGSNRRCPDRRGRAT